MIKKLTSNERSSQQLGMEYTKATTQLKRKLLYHLWPDKNCFRCGRGMSIKDFTLDHKDPWRNSPDPQALFFDLDNIAFSHTSCNAAAKRHTPRSYTPHGKYWEDEQARL
jgi:5-methylcytosine-specific restriction endonuclease McrA